MSTSYTAISNLSSPFIPSRQNHLVQESTQDTAAIIPEQMATPSGGRVARTSSDSQIAALVARRSNGNSIFNEEKLLQFDMIAFLQNLINKIRDITKNFSQLSQESLKYSQQALESAFAAAAKQLKAAFLEFGLKTGGAAVSSVVMGPVLGKIAKNAGCALLRKNRNLPQEDPQVAYNKMMKTNSETTATNFLSTSMNSVGDMSGAPLKQEAAELEALVNYINRLGEWNQDFLKNYDEFHRQIVDALKSMDEAWLRAIQLAPR